MCRHLVTKIPYLLSDVPDRYETQEMCDNFMLENSET